MHTTLCKTTGFVCHHVPRLNGCGLDWKLWTKMDAFNSSRCRSGLGQYLGISWTGRLYQHSPKSAKQKARMNTLSVRSTRKSKRSNGNTGFYSFRKKSHNLCRCTDAHWDHNPEKYVITKQLVSKGDVSRVVSGSAEGAAISIKEPAPVVRKIRC